MPNIEISQLDADEFSLSSLSSASDSAYYNKDIIEKEINGDSRKNTQALVETPSANPNIPVIPSMGGGPTVDRIGIETSTDVTIGNQTYFQGTVIIKNLMTSGDPSNVPDLEKKKRKVADKVIEWRYFWRDRKKRLIVVASLVAALLVIGLIVLIVILTSKLYTLFALI